MKRVSAIYTTEEPQLPWPIHLFSVVVKFFCGYFFLFLFLSLSILYYSPSWFPHCYIGSISHIYTDRAAYTDSEVAWNILHFFFFFFLLFCFEICPR